MVLPHINMNPPRAYTCSPPWTPLPPPSLYHPVGSSQCTSPKDPVSNLDWRFISYMILSETEIFLSHLARIRPKHTYFPDDSNGWPKWKITGLSHVLWDPTFQKLALVLIWFDHDTQDPNSCQAYQEGEASAGRACERVNHSPCAAGQQFISCLAPSAEPGNPMRTGTVSDLLRTPSPSIRHTSRHVSDT